MKLETIFCTPLRFYRRLATAHATTCSHIDRYNTSSTVTTMCATLNPTDLNRLIDTRS